MEEFHFQGAHMLNSETVHLIYWENLLMFVSIQFLVLLGLSQWLNLSTLSWLLLLNLSQATWVVSKSAVYK